MVIEKEDIEFLVNILYDLESVDKEAVAWLVSSRFLEALEVFRQKQPASFLVIAKYGTYTSLAGIELRLDNQVLFIELLSRPKCF